MRGFRLPERTQAFLSSFGPIRQRVAIKRPMIQASHYRKQFTERFDVWRLLLALPKSVCRFLSECCPCRRLSARPLYFMSAPVRSKCHVPP